MVPLACLLSFVCVLCVYVCVCVWSDDTSGGLKFYTIPCGDRLRIWNVTTPIHPVCRESRLMEQATQDIGSAKRMKPWNKLYTNPYGRHGIVVQNFVTKARYTSISTIEWRKVIKVTYVSHRTCRRRQRWPRRRRDGARVARTPGAARGNRAVSALGSALAMPEHYPAESNEITTHT